VDSLPEISNKLNGFALETIKKGYFKTATQEKVILLINSTKTPLILITKTNGEKIYYSSKDKSNKPIFDALIKTYFKELH
jgi:UDP-N-acetyl-D-mannosaminuronic acid transferase (WecB/TagA/CpsF family)